RLNKAKSLRKGIATREGQLNAYPEYLRDGLRSQRENMQLTITNIVKLLPAEIVAENLPAEITGLRRYLRLPRPSLPSFGGWFSKPDQEPQVSTQETPVAQQPATGWRS